MTVLGRTGRRIEQRGTLLDDDAAGLEAQLEAIEAAMTGEPRTLVDDLGHSWWSVVMVALDRGAVRRLGPRWAVDYTVRYVQVSE
jgi:phage protein U